MPQGVGSGNYTSAAKAMPNRLEATAPSNVLGGSGGQRGVPLTATA